LFSTPREELAGRYLKYSSFEDLLKKYDIDTKFISNINLYILNLKILFLSACSEIQNTTEIYIDEEKLYYGIFTYFLNYIIKKYRQIYWSELIYILKLLINETNKNQAQDPIIKTINFNSLDDIIKI
jgi:hypothetical protein